MASSSTSAVHPFRTAIAEAVWRLRAHAARGLPMERRKDLIMEGVAGSLLVILASALVWSRVALPVLPIALGSLALWIVFWAIDHGVMTPVLHRSYRALACHLEDPRALAWEKQLAQGRHVLRQIGALCAVAPILVLGFALILQYGYDTWGPTRALEAVAVGVGLTWSGAVVLSRSPPPTDLPNHYRPWPRPSRQVQADLARGLNPESQATLAAHLACPRWSRQEARLLERWIQESSYDAVDHQEEARILSLLPHVSAYDALRIIRKITQHQQWDLLDRLLPHWPRAWFQASRRRDLRVAECSATLCGQAPEQFARFESRMGPAVWPAAHHQMWIQTMMRQAHISKSPWLWLHWATALTDPHNQAHQLRSAGMIPLGTMDSPCLAAPDLPAWLREPDRRLALLLNLTAHGHPATLTGALEAEVATWSCATRRAALKQAVPFLADHLALAEVMDRVVVHLPPKEQVAWQQHASASGWDLTRSAQRATDLADRPAVPPSTPRARVRA